MLKRLIFILFITLSLGFSSVGQSSKAFFVDTDYILDNMEEYHQAQKSLNEFSERWQMEIERKYEEIEILRKAYQQEKILLPEEMRQKRVKEIEEKEEAAKVLQTDRFGVNGDLFKKKKELIQPIQDKIFKAIKELATRGNYTFVFDKANQSSLIYANPKMDKSNQVLKKMGINPEKDD